MMRGLIYDLTFASLTRRWYAAALRRMPVGTNVLDVGIGTGCALIANAPLLREKKLVITGLDVDHGYLRRCSRRLASASLTDCVHVREEPLESHRGGPYDVIYFSGSFMLFEDQPAALQHAESLLRPGSKMMFTQTFHKRRSPLIEFLKPRLKAVTSIEFGSVTYRSDFDAVLADAHLKPTHEEVLSESRNQAFMLIEAQPVNGVEHRAQDATRLRTSRHSTDHHKKLHPEPAAQ